MKSTSLPKSRRSGFLIAAFLALVAALPSYAISLGSADVIGYVINAEPSNGPSETARLQFFIDLNNTGAALAPDGALYTPVFGANVPLILPTPAVFGTSILTNSLGSSLTTPYTYLMAKFGADSVYYYLGGQTGTVDALFIPPQLNRAIGSLSHLSVFNQTGGPGVPDSGSTLALMGVALAMVGLFRRRFAR